MTCRVLLEATADTAEPLVWVASGTPAGGGSEMHVRGMSRHRIRDGRIVESLMTFDPLGVLPKGT